MVIISERPVKQCKIPSMEDLYNLCHLGSEHYNHNREPFHKLGKFSHFSSDWNLKEKESMHICDNPDRSQVPDLLFHGSDSSSATPNDSSPEDWIATQKCDIKWSDAQISNSVPSNYSGRHSLQPCAIGYPNCQCQFQNNRQGHKMFYPCVSKNVTN